VPRKARSKHCSRLAQFRIATPLLGLFAFVYTPVLIALVSEIAGAQPLPGRSGGLKQA